MTGSALNQSSTAVRAPARGARLSLALLLAINLFNYIDRYVLAAVEPALARTQDLIVGGLRLPGDETGDAHVFTQQLAAICESLGVAFRYGAAIAGLEAEGDRVAKLRLVTGEHLAAYVGA